MAVLELPEFRSNLLLILHNRYPKGVEISRVEAEYEKYFQQKITPSIFLKGTKSWLSVFTKTELSKDIEIIRAYNTHVIKAAVGRNDDEMAVIAKLSGYFRMAMVSVAGDWMGQSKSTSNQHELSPEHHSSGAEDDPVVVDTVNASNSNSRRSRRHTTNNISIIPPSPAPTATPTDGNEASTVGMEELPTFETISFTEIKTEVEDCPEQNMEVDPLGEQGDMVPDPVEVKPIVRPVLPRPSNSAVTGETVQLCEWAGCDKSFTNMELLQSHLKIAHVLSKKHIISRVLTSSTGDPVVVFGNANEIYTDSTGKRSSISPDQEQSCEWSCCDKSFASTDLLQNHMKIAHVLSKKLVISRVMNSSSGDTIIVLSNNEIFS